MKKKYELTDQTINVDGRTLHRIKALRDFSDVQAGELGGLKRKKICPMQVKHGSIAKPVSLITQRFPTVQKSLVTRRFFAMPAFMVVRKFAAMLRSTMTLWFTTGRGLVAEQKYLAVRKSMAVPRLVKVRRSTKTLKS